MLARQLLFVIAAIALLANLAAAQPPDQAPGKASLMNQLSGGPIISVEFGGGTAKQFVDAVRQASGPGKVNVIMPKEGESVPLPSLSLKEVSAYTALQALEYAVSSESGYQFGVSRLGKPDDTSATFAIKYATRFQGQMPMQGPPPKQETRVFSLRELVEAPAGMETDPNMVASTETVLNALSAASKLDAEARIAPPELMLHKDSLLLLVRGTSEQHRTVESVLQQMTFAIQTKRNKAAETAKREQSGRIEQAELKAQLDINASQIDLTSAEVQRAEVNLERVRKLMQAGSAPTSEVQQAEAQVGTARAIRDQAMAQRRALEERAAVNKARASAGGGGGGGSGTAAEVPVLVFYDYRDLEAFSEDIRGLARAVTTLGGMSGEGKLEYRGNGTIGVRATPSEHRLLVRCLNAMRRAKSNEPKLPGLDADDLIRKGEQP